MLVIFSSDCVFIVHAYFKVSGAQRNCEDLRLGGSTVNGIYTIDPDGAGGLQPFQVK